jgi:hypothetical protein
MNLSIRYGRACNIKHYEECLVRSLQISSKSFIVVLLTITSRILRLTGSITHELSAVIMACPAIMTSYDAAITLTSS